MLELVSIGGPIFKILLFPLEELVINVPILIIDVFTGLEEGCV